MPDERGGAPTRLANRLLREHDWARARLAPFAGRVFGVTVGPVHTAWRIAPDGALEDAPAEHRPELSLQVSPLVLPAFLANPSRWNEFVQEEGDPELGGVLKDLAQTLPWFVEAAMAKALGPVAGQRVADSGRSLLAFPEYAIERMADSAVAYARDEAQLLARGDAMRRLVADTEEATARVHALAARIDALVARLPGRG